MNWFGDPWGAPACKGDPIATPTDPCAECNARFTPSDRGLVMPGVTGDGEVVHVAYHLACLLRHCGIAP